jgi:ribose transport system substrate-binding protein
MAGKIIVSIPVSSNIPITAILESTMASVARQLGFRFVHWENQGKSDQWVQGMRYAIQQHATVIDLLAIPPGLLKPQIDEARRAGIKVVSSHFAGFGQPQVSYIDGTVLLPYRTVGQLEADWAIAHTNAHTDAVAVVANDLESTQAVVEGIKSEFANHCHGGCSVRFVNVATTNWASGVQPVVAAALQADPHLNYVIPIYDAMTQFAVAALTAARKSSQVQMDSFNGTPFALGLIAKGQLQMDIGEDEDWVARGMIDYEMRLAAHIRPPASENFPLYIWDRGNVSRAGTPPQASEGYGTAYIRGYDRLWGLKK